MIEIYQHTQIDKRRDESHEGHEDYEGHEDGDATENTKFTKV